MVSRPTVEHAGPLEAIEAYFANGWTDGLPIVPPTEAAVREFVQRAGRDAQEVLLTVSETNRQCPVEAAGINAGLAGRLASSTWRCRAIPASTATASPRTRRRVPGSRCTSRRGSRRTRAR